MWVEFESYNHRHSHEENGNVASVGVHDGRQNAILKRMDEQKRVTLQERFRYNRSRRNQTTTCKLSFEP